MDVEITELEKIDADRVDGVGAPASGIPILLMKTVAEPAVKADGSHAPFTGSHKHEHPAFGGPDGDGDGDHEHDHEHDGDADHHHSHAAKASGDDKVNCPTCDGDGKIMGGKRDCPDCDATGKVSPDKAKRLAAKSLVKAIVGRKVDEAPDIAGGTAVLAQIADLIIAEAQELKSGQAGEIADILELACAAEMIWCWRTGEESVASGSVMPATALMQSAAKGAQPRRFEGIIGGLDVADWTPEQVELFKALAEEAFKAKHNTADRKKLAEQGNALSDGSYPIADEEDLKSAAILAQSGHGDVEGAKRLISRRAKELGVKNPLDDDSDDASKGAIAQEVTSVDTVVKGSDDLSKAVADAVTKATAPLEERVAALSGELAKVKATPVPGGPRMSAAAAARKPADDGEDHAAKALYFDGWAERISDPVESDRYRQLAARERAKITVS